LRRRPSRPLGRFPAMDEADADMPRVVALCPSRAGEKFRWLPVWAWDRIAASRRQHGADGSRSPSERAGRRQLVRMQIVL
jgi:hypothetical protein